MTRKKIPMLKQLPKLNKSIGKNARPRLKLRKIRTKKTAKNRKKTKKIGKRRPKKRLPKVNANGEFLRQIVQLIFLARRNHTSIEIYSVYLFLNHYEIWICALWKNRIKKTVMTRLWEIACTAIGFIFLWFHNLCVEKNLLVFHRPQDELNLQILHVFFKFVQVLVFKEILVDCRGSWKN